MTKLNSNFLLLQVKEFLQKFDQLLSLKMIVGNIKSEYNSKAELVSKSYSCKKCVTFLNHFEIGHKEDLTMQSREPKQRPEHKSVREFFSHF